MSDPSPKPPANLTPRQRTDKAWDIKAPTFWKYMEGKRNSFHGSCEVFYQQHRNQFRDVLDIGCGSGRHLIPMLQDGLNVTGLEPSPGMRKEAEANLEAAKSTLEGERIIIAGESKHLPFPDTSFDFAVAIGAIHHNTWEEIQQSFREAARVLRPGKFFLFQGRSTKDPALARSNLVGDVGKTAQDTEGEKVGVIEHYFTEEEIRRLGAENGFEIVVQPEELISLKNHARWWVVYRKVI